MNIVIIVVSIIVVAVALYFLFPPVLICGLSMYPTYNDSEVIFGRRLYRNVDVDDVVIFKNPYAQEDKRSIAIKRITKIKSGMIYVEGDNAEVSYDSRSYGFIPKSCIIAKVIKSRPKKGL